MNSIRNIIIILYTLVFRFLKFNLKLNKSKIFLSEIKINKNNKFNCQLSTIKKTNISILGSKNEIKLNSCLVHNTIIKIEGFSNKLVISPDVKLRNAYIKIKGDNCSISIGKSTDFQGVRIINVGNNNDISIGENCLFSDHIEIWASDTHSIYDIKSNQKINNEKPIKIENNVWIGSRVIILKGVTIGTNSVIGMGSIVTKDIEKNIVAAGNPVKIIKRDVKWSLEY